jgi:cytochrome P450
MRLLNVPKISEPFRTFKYVYSPLETLEKWADKYGDTFQVKIDRLSYVTFFSNPKAIQAIFTAPESCIDLYESKNDFFKIVLGEKSLLFSSGARHKHFRKLLSPISQKEYASYFIKSTITSVKKNVGELQLNKPFNVHQTVREISLFVILEAILGLEKDSDKKLIKSLLLEIFQFFQFSLFKVSLLVPMLQKDFGVWGEFLRKKQELENEIAALIEKRKNCDLTTKRDVLSFLINACDETGLALDSQIIVEQIKTLIFAGFETTSAAICWGLYWTHYYTEIKKKLLEELNGKTLDKDVFEILRLPFLDAVCQETLRLYPVALTPFYRVTKEPMTIDCLYLPPQTRIVIPIHLVHRKESVYLEPNKFKPERFLERSFSPYEYLPFGGGDRRCLGAGFAQSQMKLVLATILKEYELKIVNDRPIKAIRYGLSMLPQRNFKMQITKNANH